MPVIQAKSAGFCYGVRRAVELAEKTARENGGCVMLGSIIHNANVVARLERLGARQADTPDQVCPGDTVVIRSHGELKSVLDDLDRRGIRCVNATCPNVLHIQRVVSRADEAGRIPLVIGEPHHPEVMGAASWSDRTLVFSGPEELEQWLLEDPGRQNLPLTAVAQTTCVRSIWESSKKILKKLCTNAELFDTICDATHRRQSEAAEIASRVDVMVVVGDRKSANTKHLTEICRELCPRVFQIEGAGELTPDLFIGCSLAGLTAGASTPAGIIKEVYTTMSEEIKNNEIKEESFEELLDKSFKTLNTGEKVTGIVTAGHRGEQGRHRRQRQGCARVRSRFPERPAPRCGPVRDDRPDRVPADHRGQPCPPPCGGLHPCRAVRGPSGCPGCHLGEHRGG